MTGTFSLNVRQKIRNSETTIQREVSRTMNSMQKMYQRGWTDSKGVRTQGAAKPLAYCWVVEIPLNAEGEENPHVHMMLDWRVSQDKFADWSARIESLWGNGYFHLEKIKDPLCAGAYMAKAAGYMTKGANQGDQGNVKGNRYGISKNARAPGWYTVSESELGVMGKLISEMHDTYKEKYSDLLIQRNLLRKTLENCPKHKNKRQSIGKKLQAVRNKISAIPIVTSKYQLILKGKHAFYKFLGWAYGAGWRANQRPDTRWMANFRKTLNEHKTRRLLRTMRWSDNEWSQTSKIYAAYEQYESPVSNQEDYLIYSSQLSTRIDNKESTSI